MKSSAAKAMPDPPARGEGVAAVERALAIVGAVEVRDRPATLAELALATGFYKSTILRLLSTLMGSGYVTRLRDGRYELGPTAFRLGAAFTRKNALGHHVEPALQDLVDRGTESASFHVRQDAENRLCLFRVNSHHETLDRVEAGRVYPLRAGAAGHIILAFDGAVGPRYDAIRAERCNISLGERDPSCAAVAAPVFGARDGLAGVLSLSGPSDRFTPADIARMKTMLRSTAVQLTRALGGTWLGSEAG